MKNNLGMKYATPKLSPMHLNSQRCLVLRQQYALTMLQLLNSGKRVINLDESWLNWTTFADREWRVKNQSWSKPKKTLTPRISLLVAISTDGHLWYTVSQAATDGNIVIIFIVKLMELLDQELPGWRADTIWLLDGAAYHSSQLM